MLHVPSTVFQFKDRNLERDWPEMKEQIDLMKDEVREARERSRIGRSSRRDDYYNYGYR